MLLSGNRQWDGRSISLRLEPEFWYWFRQIAAELGTSAPKLIEAIDKARNPDRSLSSTIRVFVACYLHDHPSPPTRPPRSVTIQAGWHSQGRSIKAHRIAIHGHQTSLRLEPEYWFWLRQIAAECGMTAKTFIESINIAKHPSRPLSSALRCSIAAYFHGNPYPIYRVDGHGCIARCEASSGPSPTK